MRTSTAIITVVIVALVGAGAYMQRGAIRDFVEDLQKPTLPTETPLQQAQSTSQPIYKVTGTKDSSTSQPTTDTTTNINNGATKTTPPPTQSEGEDGTLETEVNLAVPFVSQAPHANWDYPYQEACEEASVIMANAYFKGLKPDADQANDAIVTLVAWENQNFGFYQDTTAKETQQILKDYFGLHNTEITQLTGKESFWTLIQNELSLGNIIVVPASGKLLFNPNFQNGGPLYHMLVIKGYTKDGKIITNDPGTRKGHNYLYSLDTLYNAVHDWNGGNVTAGAKVVIVVRK